MAARSTTRLRVGDQVEVISGASKGDSGPISRFNPDRSRVYVEGVNKVRRHEKPLPAAGRAGGIIEKEASIHVSNVAFVTSDGQRTGVGYKRLENGQKARVAKKTGEVIDSF